jgi:hypothetical protein
MTKYFIGILFIIFLYGCEPLNDFEKKIVILRINDIYPDTLCIQSTIIESNRDWTKYRFNGTNGFSQCPTIWFTVGKDNKILSVWRY